MVLGGGHAKHLDAILLSVTNLNISEGRSELLASARLADGTVKNKLCVMGLEQNQHTSFAGASGLSNKVLMRRRGSAPRSCARKSIFGPTHYEAGSANVVREFCFVTF